jgi:hypothetical protein
LTGKTFYIDHTLVPDAETAEEHVAEAHDISSPLGERIHEAKDRLATVFGAQTDPVTIRVSTAKHGMNPAIIPIIKHRVAAYMPDAAWAVSGHPPS